MSHTSAAAASIKVTRLGLYANVILGIAKVISGWNFGSQALIADGYHSVSDAAGDVIAIIAIFLNSRLSATKHRNAIYNLEHFGSMIIGLMVLAGGFTLAKESGAALGLWGAKPSEESVHHHSAEATSLAAAWVPLASVLVKEYIYASTMRVAVQTGSQILASNAKHHRMDSFTSLIALGVITSSQIFTAKCTNLLDAGSGLGVAIIILEGGASTMIRGVKDIASINKDRTKIHNS